MKATNWIAVGAFSACIGVGLGAFGAHALKEKLSPEMLEVWKTAVLYQMLHAFALVLFGLFRQRNAAPNHAGFGFLLGTVCFSGSLYALALGAPKCLGPVTPLGGVLFLGSWILFAFAALRAKS